MKSDIISVSGSGAGITKAFKQAEAVAVYKSLSKKDAIHLRLLTEEMMGMMKALTGESEADFWIEDGKNETLGLHLKSSTMLTAEKRDRLLSASTSGKNAAAKGVMGKLRDLFVRAFEPVSDPGDHVYDAGWVSSQADLYSYPLSEANALSQGIYSTSLNVWSFNRYRAYAGNQPSEKENWDELEKSIIANLAEEIEIAIADGSAEMIVYLKI